MEYVYISDECGVVLTYVLGYFYTHIYCYIYRSEANSFAMASQIMFLFQLYFALSNE